MRRTETLIPPQGVDLSSCDREPIHIPGSIQPFGFLLVLEEPDGNVLQASANAGALLGEDADVEAVLGRSLDGLFGAAPGKMLRDGLANPSLESKGSVTVKIAPLPSPSL